MNPQTVSNLAAAFRGKWGTVFNQQVTNILAYGSGAFPQSSDANSTSSKTLDFIV